MRMHKHEVPVDVELVMRLIASQMPELAGQSISIVEPWGTDNAIWRIGDDHVARLPRVAWAEGQVEFEAEWLPRLSPHLDVEVPTPVAVGVPEFGYPFSWAVHRWVLGEGASLDRMADPVKFALDLAETVEHLWAIPVADAPAAKNRARPIGDYDESTRQAIDSARHLIDGDAALAVWEEALAAPLHEGPRVWVHGDLEGNCVLLNGQLHGLIDWGSACGGDLAVDVQVVWSPLFTAESRAAFVDRLGVDDATLARSRGAAINQACAALSYYLDTYPLIVERSWHKLAALGVAPLNLGGAYAPPV